MKSDTRTSKEARCTEGLPHKPSPSVNERAHQEAECGCQTQAAQPYEMCLDGSEVGSPSWMVKKAWVRSGERMSDLTWDVTGVASTPGGWVCPPLALTIGTRQRKAKRYYTIVACIGSI